MGTTATSPRIVQALKAAVAVAIAWSIAPLLPGVADDYPYYAPLGALVSMYPTLMSSVRNALQTLGGLAVGILLAGAVIVLSEPNVFTISLAVGVGAVIAASGWFGANREYIPVTALFVLIVGGPNADGYSIGYLEQMTLGILVGLAVNLLFFPPLAFEAVGHQLALFRRTLAEHLSEVADALADSWPPEKDGWASRSQELVAVGRAVRAAVSHADDSRKGNPRARLHRRDLRTDYDDLAALETVTFHVRDLTEVLTGAVWGTPVQLELRPELRPALSRALHAVAAVLRDWDPDEGATAAFTEAEAALQNLMTELDERKASAPATSMAVASTISISITRILAALRPEEAEETAPTPDAAPPR
ncbi:FUSC family protein [Cryobacterium sp. TMT1-21]|uniref:FUSC family protein n=2 Tax=Microbacteriaceae TaxID=85023 RepID=A0AAQ2HFV0_9MICO|nr:FUSC family protein [Cryobacterium shii]TFC89161.1 FUSC family protein [Cryobacterium sp. TmT2-59]TFD14134.1 FUSC family protein [Cryobacterium sp. TMT4-10]TFD17674.1 FUSC family protein [Cryobacterium sp. TMT1-21]TFD22734.1 FUSC family protein [Cryobacterium sp. TMT2-23]TFD36254.1 FUSC family protein [Cryobacterium sp. TMT2-10]